MKVKKDINGESFYLEFDENDWKINWKNFVSDIKKLKGWKFENQHWIMPMEYFQTVIELKKKHSIET